MLLNVISRPGQRVRGDAAPARGQPRAAAAANAGTSCGRSPSTGRCSPRASSSGSPEPDAEGRIVRLVGDLQLDFALNQPLSPFVLAAIELLDHASPTYALDVLSVVEATLDDPRPVLYAQQSKARGEAVAAMKAEGLEYEERMARLEEVTWPQPLDELLEAALDDLPAGGAVGRGRAPVAEVGGPRHVRAVDDVRRVRRLLPARPLRGPGPALPRRHLPRAAPDRARRGQDRGARRHREPGWASWCARSTRRLLDEWEALAAGEGGGESAPPPLDERRPAPSPATSARSASSCATRCSAGWSWPRCGAGTSSASSTRSRAGTPTPGATALQPYFAEYGDTFTAIGTGPAARGPRS